MVAYLQLESRRVKEILESQGSTKETEKRKTTASC